MNNIFKTLVKDASLHPELLEDLLLEVGDKNRVRVSVRRGQQEELVHDSTVDLGVLRATPAMLVKMECLRLANGLKAKMLPEVYRRLGADLVSVSYNLRTNVGIDYCATQLGGSSSATSAKYLALSNNTNAPDAANTSGNTTNTRICWGTATATDAAASTSRGEYTALGMARALATYAHTGSATSYTQAKTFTATGACTNLQCCGCFDNSAQGSGTLFTENSFVATSLANTNQLTLTWAFNL